jgi:hypothetical protein
MEWTEPTFEKMDIEETANGITGDADFDTIGSLAS